MPSERPVAVPSQQELAVERTVMAHERTLMAWLRTSLAMISFGFTLREFFDFLVQKEGRRPVGLLGTRSYGLLMMLTGLTVLVMASVQHIRTMRRLSQPSRRKRFPLTLVFAFACLLLGSLALAATVHEIGQP